MDYKICLSRLKKNIFWGYVTTGLGFLVRFPKSVIALFSKFCVDAFYHKRKETNKLELGGIELFKDSISKISLAFVLKSFSKLLLLNLKINFFN